MTRLLFTLLTLSVAFSAAAQSDSLYSLEEVVVTANRFSQKQINTGKVMTVIKRNEIENSPFLAIGE
jgi:outer membrane cobalamin receptor